MTLKDILAKPIKLIGGGILNLKGFSKFIVNRDVGSDEDSFPYEYYCPDDFSIIINPEDWTVGKGESVAEKQIPTQVKIPESYSLKLGTCNDVGYSAYDEGFYILYDEIGLDLFISFDIISNTISIINNGELDPSELEPITFNFKDLIFLGNKK